MGYLLIIALFLLAVAFVASPFWRRTFSLSPEPLEEVEELLREKAALYRSIRELDLDYHMGKLSSEDYQDLRRGYEVEAATLLARLDELDRRAGTPLEGRRPAEVALGRGASAPRFLKGWAAYAAAAVLLIVMGVMGGYLLARSSQGEKSGQGQPFAASPRVAELERRLQGNPQDTRALLDLAHLYLDQGAFRQAIDLYKQVLNLDPRNVEAITHIGVILSKSPHPERALEVFNKALSIDPDYPHALWDKARLLDKLKDYQGAIETWERFIAVAPSSEDAKQARGFIEEARRKLKEESRASVVR